MLRSTILALAGSERAERFIASAPVSRNVVARFVAGTTTADAVRAASELERSGLTSTIDYLGEQVGDVASAEATKNAYLALINALGAAQLTGESATAAHRTELSVKMSALGVNLDAARATDTALAIAAHASAAGIAVTLDAEDHATTDATFLALDAIRKEFPDVGAVVQAYLRRAEADCRELATAGSRVRLCKGAYQEPPAVAFQSGHEVDLSYVRCINRLLAGGGYPMFATHDPRLIAVAEDRVDFYRRTTNTFEFQLLYGVRPAEQRRLATAGYTVRVYLPYGTQWYPYLLRRLAERPANLMFFLRAALSRTS